MSNGVSDPLTYTESESVYAICQIVAWQKGDINRSGTVELADCMLLRGYIENPEFNPPDEGQLFLADTDSDETADAFDLFAADKINGIV